MTKEIEIYPLTKYPGGWRIGPKKWQDWYCGCRQALRLSSVCQNARIVIVSGLALLGDLPEADFYEDAFQELGATSSRVLIVRECRQTTDQIRFIENRSRDKKIKPVIVSTWLHYPRVRFICRGKKFIHKIVFGIPRPREAITDVFMIFLFPLLDVFGWWRPFEEWVDKRRKKGAFF